MDPDRPPPLQAGCSCCAPVWSRAVKRRLDDSPAPAASRCESEDEPVSARVEADEEAAALREALAAQQQTVAELCAELDEERSAASTAATEAMSMILRLQREKAEAQMEARQFKRFAEERMAHDQRQLATLDDLLRRRDDAIRSLSLQLRAHKDRLLTLGLDTTDPPITTTANAEADDLPLFDYPPLRCTVPADAEFDGEDDNADPEEYAETPQIHEDLQSLQYRTYQLDRTPSSSRAWVSEKGVVERGPMVSSPFVDRNEFPRAFDRAWDDEYDKDDADDRVYTIVAVHGAPPVATVCDEPVETPREVWSKGGGGAVGGEGEGDIKKLYERLHSLEADRESMQQAIISMRTEKAQLALLREIAQHLCKEGVASQQKRAIKKPSSLVRRLAFVSVIKWFLSIIFWRKKASQCKYPFGQTKNNAGLLLLLDKSTHMGQWTRA